jgi:hypothetical protein
MNKIPYKGYLIRPASFHLVDTDRWNIELYISKDRGSEITERKFSASDTFKTQEEAIQHCVNFGKQIIDGKSENCTVGDL